MATPLVIDRLDRSARFVDAAAIAFAEARSIRAFDCCAITLHASSGPPVLVVEDAPDHDGRWLDWTTNPVFVAMRAHVRPTGLERSGAHVFASPLLGPDGWFATLCCSGGEPCSIASERDLAMIATRLSVWCAARGIAAIPVLPPAQQLPARQYRIAQLCASMTNPEIASALGISINTVKQRLKQIFDRLGVDGRDALERLLRRFAPLEGIPLGVTRVSALTVTRDSHTAAWVP